MIEVVKGNPELTQFLWKNKLFRTREFLADVIKKGLPNIKFVFREIAPAHYIIECEKIPSLILVVFRLVFPEVRLEYATPEGNFEILKTSDSKFEEFNKITFHCIEHFLDFSHSFFDLKFRTYNRKEYLLMESNQLHPVFLEKLAHGIDQPLYLQLGELKDQVAPPDNLQ